MAQPAQCSAATKPTKKQMTAFTQNPPTSSKLRSKNSTSAIILFAQYGTATFAKPTRRKFNFPCECQPISDWSPDLAKLYFYLRTASKEASRLVPKIETPASCAPWESGLHRVTSLTRAHFLRLDAITLRRDTDRHGGVKEIRCDCS